MRRASPPELTHASHPGLKPLAPAVPLSYVVLHAEPPVVSPPADTAIDQSDDRPRCSRSPVASPASASTEPIARGSATCADYPNQAAAQRAAGTPDSDGERVYCESL